MGMTLFQLKKALGARIDDAMARCTRFSVPEANFCDLSQIHMFSDLPRALYYWSVEHAPEAVMDVITTKNYLAMTAEQTERIPHTITLKITVIANDVDWINEDDSQWQSDTMRDAIFAEFGHHPCITYEGESIPLYYEGVVDGPSEFKEGIYSYTFTYVGLIFLDGRSETNPLVSAVNFDLRMVWQFNTSEEVEQPTPDPDSVTVTENQQESMDI